MKLHPDPLYQPIPVKALIPKSLGTRSQRINPWIPSDERAAAASSIDADYELKEAQIKPLVSFTACLPGWSQNGILDW